MTRFPFLEDPSLMNLMEILQSGGIEARFVGGCVRNALLGVPISDMDMAVDGEPERVLEVLRGAGIHVIPTGIDHGTVTAILDHKPIELTTLREDVKSHGRHADVAFTNDWKTDASRRDFTVNALYVDGAGELYDYFGGVEDLSHHRIRFIGTPQDRIREDYLRILRFFRFAGTYGRGHFDGGALEACGVLKEGLVAISRERKTQELFKLFVAPHALDAWEHMERLGILSTLFGGDFSSKFYGQLAHWEKTHGLDPNPVRVCAALPLGMEALNATFSLSNEQKKTIQFLKNYTLPLEGEDPFFDPLYRHGKVLVREALILKCAEDNLNPEPLLNQLEVREIPVFPLKGADLLARGQGAGPELGETLKTAENWWISERGRPTREECLAFLIKN